MLHLTNGDVAAALIRQTGVPGAVVAWRDVLHEGPVPAGLSLEAMSDRRARFVAQCGWAPLTDALRQFGARDAALRSARQVTLWFEHDLYDQLQLLQILAVVAEQSETRATLICIDRYPGVERFRGLGQLSPTQLAQLWSQRRPVTPAQLTLALRGWKAFCASDPLALPHFAKGDLRALPYLGAALARLREEFPSGRDGLGRTDRQILSAVAAGNRSLAEIQRTFDDLEAAPFHGDASLQLHLTALASCRTPLLTGSPWELTAAGRRVLEGTVDQRQLNGIDRWIGGVHLTQ